MRTWNTTVKELLEIFRESLIAMVPIFEKAKLTWQSPDAYDEWDLVVESLYKSIVCTALYNESIFDFPIAKYGYTIDDYSKLDYIEVIDKNNKSYIFRDFDNSNEEFNKINVVELEKSNKLKEDIKLDFNEADFRFVKKSGNKTEYIIDIVTGY